MLRAPVNRILFKTGLTIQSRWTLGTTSETKKSYYEILGVDKKANNK